jgi:dihydroneopterin aldolase
MSADTVFIRGLRAETVIGVYDWERRVRQLLVLDLELAVDTRAAAASDEVADTLDYGAIAERMLTEIEGSSHRLIETLAERLAAVLLAEFTVPWVRLTLSKPTAVPAAQAVGITIERGSREPGAGTP